jgi:predicted nucleotidyltransferase
MYTNSDIIIALPNMEESIKELMGDNMNNIIKIEATPRHMHTFFVVLEYSIISCVVVKVDDDNDDEELILYII